MSMFNILMSSLFFLTVLLLVIFAGVWAYSVFEAMILEL